MTKPASKTIAPKPAKKEGEGACKMGRPKGSGSRKTPEAVEVVLDGLSNAVSLRKLHGAYPEIVPPPTTVIGWTVDDPDFAERYARARQAGISAIAEEIKDFSDDDSRDAIDGNVAVQRARLQVESRKWLLSKLRPDIYGDRITVNATIEELNDSQLDSRVDSLSAAFAAYVSQTAASRAAGSVAREGEAQEESGS